MYAGLGEIGVKCV